MKSVFLAMKRASFGNTQQTPIPYAEGENTALALKSEVFNLIAQLCNAVKKIEGKSGIKVTLAEGNLIIELEGGDTANPLVRDGGVYDSAKAYKKGTVVVTRQCVTADTDEVVACSESTDTWKWGTWIAAQDVPAGQEPTWPEPATIYWRMWSIGVGEYREVEVCIGANPKLRTIVGSHVYEES